MIDDRFDVFLDSVWEHFNEYFCIDIHKGNWSEVLFLCWVFVWCRYLNKASRMNWVEYLLLPFCEIVCEEPGLDLL